MEEGGRKGGKANGKGAGNCPQALPSRADDSRTQAGHRVGRNPKQIDAGVEVWDGMQPSTRLPLTVTGSLVEGFGEYRSARAAGYDLVPEEIDLAVRWLELNDPEYAIGIEEVKGLAKKSAQRSQEAAVATTGEVLPAAGQVHPGNASQFTTHTQLARADSANISKRQQKKLDALKREAPGKLDEVKAGTKSVHRACIEAGIVKVPTPLQRGWVRISSPTPAPRQGGERLIGSRSPAIAGRHLTATRPTDRAVSLAR